MANVIKRVYELQDIGKGVITALTEDNLLKIVDSEAGLQGLQYVIQTDRYLDAGFNNNILLYEGASLGIEEEDTSQLSGSFNVKNYGYLGGSAELSFIGKNQNSNYAGLHVLVDKMLVSDDFFSKGFENKGDYESNFTARSLVTKQYVDSISGSTPDATDTVKGKLRLTGDLGGTADAPTTPTAIHKTGNEFGITGDKAIISSASFPSRWRAITNIDATMSALLSITGSTAIPGYTAQSQNIAPAIKVISSGGANSKGILIEPDQNAPSAGNMLILSNKKALNDIVDVSTPLVVLRDGIIVTTISDLGNITANSFIKSGGTNQQILLADGTTSELNPQKTISAGSYALTDADNNYTIFIDNGATAMTISIGAITIPNFCVGFIQEGTADVTYAGVTNPIGLKSKGQGYQQFVERKLNTSTYYLLGNTKA